MEKKKKRKNEDGERKNTLMMNNVCSEVLEYTFNSETDLGLLLGCLYNHGVFNLFLADESPSNCYISLFVSRTFDDPLACIRGQSH